MGMLGTCIDLQILEDSIAEAVLGQHAANSVLNDECRLLRKEVRRSSEALTSRETGVARVDLVGQLVARELHLVRIDYDDEITAISVRSVAGLVLASEDLSHLRRKTSQHLVRRVDNEPLFLSSFRIDRDGFVT